MRSRRVLLSDSELLQSIRAAIQLEIPCGGSYRKCILAIGFRFVDCRRTAVEAP